MQEGCMLKERGFRTQNDNSSTSAVLLVLDKFFSLSYWQVAHVFTNSRTWSRSCLQPEASSLEKHLLYITINLKLTVNQERL